MIYNYYYSLYIHTYIDRSKSRSTTTRSRSKFIFRSRSLPNFEEDVEIARTCNKNKRRKLIATVEQTKSGVIELSNLIIAKHLFKRICFDLQTFTENFNHQFLKTNFNTPPQQYDYIFTYQYYKQHYDFEIARSCKKSIFECENIKLNKSNLANSQANLIFNSDKESSEKKGKANDSQEKQDNSLLNLYSLDKLRENEDVNIKIRNDSKSKDGEGLLHCLGHQHAKSELELWKDLLSTGNFKFKPCNIHVFIVDNIPRHPARLGNIQWSWLVEEIWRIHTFSNYPQNAAKSAILLASDGFAYMGSGKDVDDSVICFFCESVKNKWQPLDDICEVHKQLSPNCSMVTHINCPNIPLKTNHDSSLFDKVFQIQKYPRNLNASENSIGIQDIEHDGEITATNRSNLPVSSQAVPEHPRSIAAPPSQSRRADDSSQGLLSDSPSVTESPSSAVSSITTAVSNNSTTTPGNRVLSTANNLVSDSSLVTVSASSTDTEVSSTDTAVPSTNTAAPSTDTAAGHSSAAASTSNTVNQAVANSSQNATKGNAGGPTYSELGIVTERPKRFEYAVLLKRIETFLSWPRDHHLRPKELAEAGFYYAGYGDCARCFYCGGGLRNWEDEDDVWVEHARWFPKCAYIRQQMGQVFVDIVQELNKTNDHIPFKMVMEKIGDAASSFQLDSKDNPLKRDPAVKTIVDMGFPIAEVIAKAEAIKDDGNILSADKIYEKLVADNVKKSSSGLNITRATSNGEVPAAVVAKDIEKLRTLKEMNNQLRQQTVCKICMDKEVAVVFLPCGHFVSCTDCAAAMKDCPVCRNHREVILCVYKVQSNDVNTAELDYFLDFRTGMNFWFVVGGLLSLHYLSLQTPPDTYKQMLSFTSWRGDFQAMLNQNEEKL
ncbi:baculoviral IAP repeat-containing protein 2-like isoform X1 [Biomphalaria pfeifferi]|uniref:Baculoviral IAP repeat-containing protein 2-like isoform X1 n=1 Tax=Biomphalaria pfeifferi TaxID=112525 RepID=A0AAD8EXP4_BIOPF|nr:baculoviral IAP repeat-containing protein 2-like isoform X1 [Biomphalaria pfeifferi]